MQVSSLDTVLPPGSEKDVSKPATAASDAFAILVQNAFQPQTNPGLLRLADASSLGQQLSASRDALAEARPADDAVAEETVEFDNQDRAPAPDKAAKDGRDDDAADTVGPAETLLILADLPIPLDQRISLDGATAVAAAAEGRAGVANQQGANARPAAAETLAGTPAIPSNNAGAQSGAAASSKNGGADGRIPASVTETGQQFVSRPTNTLAAAATLAAQTGKAGGPADASAGNGNGNGNGTPGTAGATGNLLLSDTGGKTMYQGNGQRGAAQGAPTPSPAGNAAGVATTNANAPSAAFAASLAASQTSLPPAATRPLPGAERTVSALPLEPAALGGPISSTAGLARAGTAAPPPRPAPPPGALRGQIAVQVQKAVAQGVDRISIQLKPAELGRVEIRLEIAQDGKVSTLVTVDRPDTLDLLQRDARGLQQVLQDAGLKTDSSGLSFNLRGGDTAPQEQAADGGGTADQNGADSMNSGELAESQDESMRRRANDSLIDVEV